MESQILKQVAKNTGKLVKLMKPPLKVKYDEPSMRKTYGNLNLEDKEIPKGFEPELNDEIEITVKVRVSELSASEYNDRKKCIRMEILEVSDWEGNES